MADYRRRLLEAKELEAKCVGSCRCKHRVRGLSTMNGTRSRSRHATPLRPRRIKAKRENLTTLRKKYNKTEDDLKALQARAAAS